MSRVGKMPVKLPVGVNVNITGQSVEIECSSKKLGYRLPAGIKISKEEGRIVLERDDNTARLKALQGLSRALLNNMVMGVKEGFKKNLEMVGRGKKAMVKGKSLILEVGFSHPVDFKLPDGIEAKVEKNIIQISGIDKQKVGEVAAEIRDIQPPEPYKGSGIRYEGEQVKKKAGKSAVGGGFTGGGK